MCVVFRKFVIFLVGHLAMIAFSSISSYSLLPRGDDLVSSGISTGGGIPFGSDTIYTVYVCMYLVCFCKCAQCMYVMVASM